jgi:hypothetical protein
MTLLIHFVKMCYTSELHTTVWTLLLLFQIIKSSLYFTALVE